jgi:Rps23 Pro-64 3,4-dihydroxylase Tpa1-like proline 4-hydroxylase
MQDTAIEASWYWKWDQAIPARVCETLLDEIKNSELTEGVIGYASVDKNENLVPEIRKSKTLFLSTNHWFEGIMFNHARYANVDAGWNFKISGTDPIQVAVYGPGEKYEWHSDDWLLSRGMPHHRKITVVIQLSKASDFTGGGLYLKNVDQSLINEQGDVIIFPAFMEHRAAPVESGKRITIVCWITGEYFS